MLSLDTIDYHTLSSHNLVSLRNHAQDELKSRREAKKENDRFLAKLIPISLESLASLSDEQKSRVSRSITPTNIGRFRGGFFILRDGNHVEFYAKTRRGVLYTWINDYMRSWIKVTHAT